MTEPTEAPSSSLIQQRMALRRRRSYAIYMLVSSVVIGTFWVLTLIVDDSAVWRWIGAVVFTVGVLLAAIEFARVRRDTRAFDERYGSDAGMQRPVR
ncbi:hypothetical protein [Microbacterium sp. 179-I 3D3 NHS]|uniref:hypothetical protein n=1 Tax=Microbacterium sp. 179-I 3D3 NHS TaxID=3142382 RepID=UPI00399F9839